jgi:hypothetical protein
MGRRIELAESQSFEAADILLPTAGAIEGRVVDEFGDPAPGILVRLATTEFLAGATRLVPAGTTVLPQPTDDRGQFRIFGVPPGEYYAMALSGPFVQGSDASGFGVTLYPGTRSGPDARPIRVASGADTVGVDFALIAVPGSSVRGVVNTQDNIPISGASVSLMPMTGGDVRIWAGASTIAAADGSFVLPYIPEGTYAIRAVGRVATSDSPAAVMEGYLTVDIKGASPATVRIEARPRSTLRGRIVFDGEAPYPSVSDVQLDVLPMDFVSSPVEALVRIPRWSDDNSFTLGNLVGRSVIRAQVRPGSWIVSRVMLDHQDITDVPLDFGHGDISNVEIVLRRTGASVSGTVSDRGQPAEEYTVVVFSEDPLKWTWPSRFVMLGWRNQHGGYRVTGLSPGAYRAIALSQVPGRMWTSPEFLREAFASASPFRVLEGEGLTLPLRLVVR